MPDTDTLVQTALWFEKAVPEPSSKNIHTQLGCHFEEVAEMLATLDPVDNETSALLYAAQGAVQNLAQHLKDMDGVLDIRPKQYVELLDALCDQIVTAMGVGHMLRYRMVPAMRETNASNWSKFVDGEPVFDRNRKIRKGPGYFRPHLAPFVAVPVLAD